MLVPFPLRGESPAITRTRHLLIQAAKTCFPVLLTGESGTGKQAAAEWVHHLSPRNRAPFIEVNASCWNGSSMVHSLLFGHEKGAFTGADRTHKGCFELAHGGTLFLDEIGELDPIVQPMLLKILDRGRLERVGAQSLRQIDVRLICATNRDLENEAHWGRFRQDLLARIRCLEIRLPSLGERLEDLEVLWEGIRELRGLSVSMPCDLPGRIRCEELSGNLRGLEKLAIQRMVWGETSSHPC
jgi:DNA-binding NtrC family response regulator